MGKIQKTFSHCCGRPPNLQALSFYHVLIGGVSFKLLKTPQNRIHFSYITSRCGIKRCKILYFMKHFYRSLQSSRVRAARNTVNVWDHMSRMTWRSLEQFGWSACALTVRPLLIFLSPKTARCQEDGRWDWVSLNFVVKCTSSILYCLLIFV